jgi:CRP-like cAMP-binding protein/uncharacterized membrane protein YdbT with pleckstrin-like domain
VQDRIGLLRRTYLFAGLSKEELQCCAELLQNRSVTPKATLYRQGDPDSAFYIVVSGLLKAWTRDEDGQPRILGHLHPGDCFGVRALLMGQRRDVTVEAEEASKLLCLRKQDLDQLLQRRPGLDQALRQRLSDRLRNMRLFRMLPESELRRLAALIGETTYRQGAIISSPGEAATSFYILEQGLVGLLRSEAEETPRIVERLRPGDYLGGTALLTGRSRQIAAKALEDSRLLYIDKRDFDEALSKIPHLRRALTMEAQARELATSEGLPWQREGERLLVLARKHLYAFVRSLWPVVLLLVAAGTLLSLAYIFDWRNFWVFAGSGLLGAAAVGLFFWLWLDWRNDYYAVTNKRVVHLDKTVLLSESREEAPLESIQDISIVMPSIMGRLFGFDDLNIQTAGAKGTVLFKTVGNAAWIRDKLFEQMERARAEERDDRIDGVRRRLEREFGRSGEGAFTFAQVEPTGAQPAGHGVGRPALMLLRRARGYLIPYMRLEEAGVVTWRKHWFRLIDRIAGPFILVFMLAQLGFAALLRLAAPPPRFEGVFWTALVMGILLGFFVIWYRYEDWRNDVYQLTDDRIIDVEKLPLGLREERREASLSMIQDIGYEIPGVIANLLDYGNVFIETAGREAVFTFSWVHEPRQVQQEVFARMDAFRERAQRLQKEQRANELLDWFATYAELSEQEKPEDEQESD